MPRDDTNTHPDLPDLSNEDVAILYEIINVSSQTTHIGSLPFRAIFAAYDEVLSRHGISSAHDQLYLRFLFRLGERLGRDDDGEEKDLFTEFESLLLELGIKIEVGSTSGSFVADELSIYNENAENETPPDTQPFTDADTPNDTSGIPRRARRVSYSEVLDVAEEAKRAQRDWPESPASISRLQDTSDGFGSRPFTRRKNRRNSDNTFFADTEADEIRPQPANSRINLDRQNSVTRSPASIRPTRRPIGAVASYGSPQRRHLQKAPTFDIYEDSSRAGSINNEAVNQPDLLSLSDQQEPESDYLARQENVAHVSNSFRIQNLCRRLLHKWQILVATKEDQRHQMLQLAIAYDRRELIKQAWLEWFEKHKEKQRAAELQRQQDQERRQAEERERVQHQREENAAKARDVYLISKAFSHWVNCAAEHVKENNLARDHLTKVRCFRAWKTITAANESKIRGMALRKFLATWKTRLRVNTIRRQQALIVHDNSLQQSIYWNWFWKFCDRRAPEWRNVRLKQQYFRKWVIAVRERVEQDTEVKKKRQQNFFQECYRHWITRAEQKKVNEQKADNFRTKQLTSNMLKSWRTAAKLAPLARKVTGMVNWRIASTTFSTLQFRCVIENQADRIDRRRVVKNTWTSWNDELRVRTMQHQINDRLVLQALYKWVLAGRAALMRRVHEERLQQVVLRKLLSYKKKQDDRLMEAEQRARKISQDKLMKAVMTVWINKRALHKTQGQQALGFRMPRVMSPIILSWHEQHQHIAELERESVEAAYYLRGKRSLKKWTAATEESKKQKRREAYVLVKRTYNSNLAKAAFQLWKQQTDRVLDLHNKENNFRVARTEKLLFSILQHWSQRSSTCEISFDQAVSYDANKLASATIQIWSMQLQIGAAHSTTAALFYNTRIQKTAYENLRRLQLKILELQSHNAKAVSVLNWNTRRRARGLFLAWSERASSRRQATTQTQTSSDPGPLIPQGATLLSLARTPRSARRIQTSQQPFTPHISPEHILPEIPAQTPFGNLRSQIPAYLSTPSHRAARAKALSSSSSNYNHNNSTIQFPHQPASQTQPLATSTHSPPTNQNTTTSFTPSTNPLRKTIRFAEEDTIMESPLRLPEPTPPPIFKPQRERNTQTDIQPRRQIAAAAAGGRLGSSMLLGNSLGSVVGAGAGAGTGVRRSLFPHARKRDAQGQNQNQNPSSN